ncbi:RING finger protein 166-like [Acanthaster planci]|uniref:RING finger protein 166-like n=1 Tax=Acanthaster planci TaxID=133434 RepID=A0A8B7ZQZ6_ACAPL|nr:RING finger protein 166-like [Acanthaster planci]XP_022107301.1 RING finger protein 166-like [Acanthaster planci]
MASIDEGEDDLKCGICLEVYCKPVRIACGHVFCEECLATCSDVASPICALCRMVFDPKKRVKAKDIEKRISSTKSVCSGCGKKMSMSKIRSHTATCTKLETTTDSAVKFKPVATTSQKAPRNIPNRSTFKCPYCGLKNLDSSGLTRHCNKEHKECTSPVVCPVCASMPWGDPNYQSSNFIEHLNLRHRFEYDTYVDYGEDEEAVLRKVLESSLQDK